MSAFRHILTGTGSIALLCALGACGDDGDGNTPGASGSGGSAGSAGQGNSGDDSAGGDGAGGGRTVLDAGGRVVNIEPERFFPEGVTVDKNGNFYIGSMDT